MSPDMCENMCENMCVSLDVSPDPLFLCLCLSHSVYIYIYSGKRLLVRPSGGRVDGLPFGGSSRGGESLGGFV